MGILLSFLPWIAFWVLSDLSNYQAAALTATVAVVLINLRNIRQRKMKILDLGTLIFFLFLTGVSFFSQAAWVDRNSSLLSDLAMFVIAAVSLVIRKPFTIQYAYEQVDPKYWNSPGFYTTNRTISTVWCLAFAINAVMSYLYADTSSTLGWLVRVVVLVAAIKFTGWYPDFVRAKAEQADGDD